MPAPATGVLLTSMPEEDFSLAAGLLPGARLATAPLTTDLADRYPDTRILAVAYSDRVEPATLERFTSLDAVITRSDGFDHLPIRWMRAHGIPGYHLGDYAVEAVAHYTLAMVLALLRRLPGGVAEAKGLPDGEPGWDRRLLVGRSLRDATVGVLGTGRIGSRVARLLVDLGADVIGHDVSPDSALERQPRFRYVQSLERFLTQAEVLTIHVPLTSETRGLVDGRALDRLPPASCVVNTARGAIVDQAAVEVRLRDGRLAGYAADVLPGEPAPPDLARFRDLPNAWITPHLAAYDARTIRERYARTARVVEALNLDRAADVAEFQCA